MNLSKFNFPFSDMQVTENCLDLPKFYFLDDRPTLQDSMTGHSRFSTKEIALTKTFFLIDSLNDEFTEEVLKMVIDNLCFFLLLDIVLIFQKRLGLSKVPPEIQCRLLLQEPRSFMKVLEKIVSGTRVR
jgi:hypothetical protein